MYVKDYFKSKPEVSGYIDACCTLHQKFWLKNKIGMKNFDNKTCWSVRETTADAMIYMYEGNNCWLNDTRNICSSSLPFVCVDRGLRTKIFMSLIYIDLQSLHYVCINRGLRTRMFTSVNPDTATATNPSRKSRSVKHPNPRSLLLSLLLGGCFIYCQILI